MTADSMIADSFTEDVITKLSQEEAGKRQHYRPVYSIHKWWARRPGTLFRAIILLLANKGSRKPLFVQNGRNGISDQSLFFQSHNLNNMVILDPFMGGGTTLAEANRLGAKVIGSDINPVSHWIVRETLKPIDLEKLHLYFAELEKTAEHEIKSLYRTKCSICGNENSDTMHAFWVRYIECPHCGNQIYLFKRCFINRGMKRNQKISKSNPAIVVCPHCNGLNKFNGGSCRCEHCEATFNPDEGVFDKGKYSCPHCHSEGFSLIKTIQNGGILKEELIAIEYYCPDCKERLYKSPDEYDLKKIENAQILFETERANLLFPTQEIPQGTSSARWIAHNFRYYNQVFNPRQIVAFNYLISAINQISEKEYRNAFLTVFSNALEYNNMMVPYNYPHRKLHHLFTYHALPLTTTPVENCVWGVSDKGAGTFVNCYQRYVRAKKYCHRPFEKFKNSNNKINTVYPKEEKIEAAFVSSFQELISTEKGAWLHCRDSSDLPLIPDNSVDAVITDPPYFDNIHYSELSNFFYVWLKLFMPNKYFRENYVPIENEAIVNNGMGKTEDGYYHLMKSVFSESARVLKDDGVLIFTFHHSNPTAWWTVFRAVVDSGFVVDDYFPVKSEYKVNPHVRGKNAIDTDLVIMCSKNSSQDISNDFSVDTVLKSAETRAISLNRSSRSKDKLVFYYIGELLKIGSKQASKVSFNHFYFVFQKSKDFAIEFCLQNTMEARLEKQSELLEYCNQNSFDHINNNNEQKDKP